MTSTDAVEWLALAFSTSGTLLWATGRSQFLTGILWTLSSILWVYFGMQNGHAGLMLRETLGVFMAGMGAWTHFKRERLKRQASIVQQENKSPAVDAGALACAAPPN